MHISLTDRLDEYVKSKVQTGLYNNASEVIREALRLKVSTEELRLKDAIEPAWQQAEQGECQPFEIQSVIDELDEELAPHA